MDWAENTILRFEAKLECLCSKMFFKNLFSLFSASEAWVSAPCNFEHWMGKTRKGKGNPDAEGKAYELIKIWVHISFINCLVTIYLYFTLLKERDELQKFLRIASEQKKKDDSLFKAREQALDEREEKLKKVATDKDRKEVKVSYKLYN